MSPEELIEKYSDMAYCLALRLTGNATEAEDLAEEALIKAMKGLPGFRGDSEPGVWVSRIVANCWKNQLRSPRLAFWRRLGGFNSTDGEEQTVDPPDPAPGPELQLEGASRREAFEKVLNSLEPRDRAIVALRELDGRSYTEIAGILSIPEGTVRSRLSRARKKLRGLLGGFLEEK
ncbi:MAG: RNA polymerase sigma factor [Elusimicrobia bacterium]|nr:RNA polymerase sigma factor [Elusimicrobiota bacterium]